jgi:uncharacterized membrane protein
MRKTEDLELLTDAELTQRIVKIARKVPQAFGVLAMLAITATAVGFALNSNGHPIAGGVVSMTGALVVIGGAFYMRKLRLENDALIQLSNKRFPVKL